MRGKKSPHILLSAKNKLIVDMKAPCIKHASFAPPISLVFLTAPEKVFLTCPVEKHRFEESGKRQSNECKRPHQLDNTGLLI